MGRKKSRPIRSGAILPDAPSSSKRRKTEIDSAKQRDSPIAKPVYVDVDKSHWDSPERREIAEVVVHNVDLDRGVIDHQLDFGLRLHLCEVEEASFRMGQWPVVSVDKMVMEYVVGGNVVWSGVFDGPDDGVSGLAHLVSLKLLGLRLVLGEESEDCGRSFRVRVEVLQNFFDASESLLGIGRQSWRKSMMNVMSWLRPEVTTSEVRYGSNQLRFDDSMETTQTSEDSSSRKHVVFDADSFYEAIKPSKEEPMLDDQLPQLLPQLRPYQRRAAYWMVEREKRAVEASEGNAQYQQPSPFCVSVTFLESHSKMFYNPFNGSVSLLIEAYPTSYVSGGILADEMGLGKTVELLACVFAHRKSSLEDKISSDGGMVDVQSQIKRPKRERVECICGAVSESSRYEGLWVQCDLCDAWQHADCVGYSPKKKTLVSHETTERRGSKKVYPSDTSNISEVDEEYVCSLCSELNEAAQSKVSAAATLVVCPAPILAQWHSEITRHTAHGSLKIYIYEGAKNLSTAALRSIMDELATSDIVLTTYDVLKEDLSHDSDRHDGDRRLMRFQKRYPVVPTLLTRIHWWRLCLDEAQMVECNTSSVTEMAMRLHAHNRWCITGTPIQRRLDDIYGLLHFLRLRPYDVYKWWVEVIRDPYERRDMAAMEFVHNFFKQIMWRSSKAHVSDELELPPQELTLTWLTFSPVEEHFYHKQHETCLKYAHEIIKTLKEVQKRNPNSGYEASCDVLLSYDDVSKLLYPLLKLRQACCHPQIGSSGLCSLQHSPLTMDEILEVLISKAKVEGEEALRRIVVAVNGLAGLAVIENDNKQAVALYKEALALADENCNDFDLDPLLSLHIHHNLADMLPFTSEYMQQCPSLGRHSLGNSNGVIELPSANNTTNYYVRRHKIGENHASLSTTKPLMQDKELHNSNTSQAEVDSNSPEGDAECLLSSRCLTDSCLRKTCESIKEKYLSVFVSRLTSAQQEFRSSYIQVCNISLEFKKLNMTWWLDALDVIESNKDFSHELMKRVDEAVSKASSKSSKASSRFRTVSGLKYAIQSGLDLLETSRQALIDRLMEIDQTMEKPKDGDIDRLRYCPNCGDGDGAVCIHCELDDLFQNYEARLFLLTKGKDGALVASVEEALDLQKQKSELNRFFRDGKTSIDNNRESKQRHVRLNVQVTRKPSILEITLGVIKGYLKTKLGKLGVASSREHLLLFEAMRKEYVQARGLSLAQARLLGAHDEIRWSVSRLCLRVTDDESTAVNFLSKEELIPSNMQFTSDKLLSLSTLARVKGQLRYLKGLMSKKKTQHEHLEFSSTPQAVSDIGSSDVAREEKECAIISNDEPCPICQEKLFYQKMVFQCGHVVCCKCCLQMTERAAVRVGKCQRKWIMCPTCRQHTNIENIAFVDEKQHKDGDLMTANTLQANNIPESSIVVRGSYGTKIGAITRKILWITSGDQEAKVLVFSSWNGVLDVLGHALAANDVTYVRMKGGRKSQVAIARFKERPTTGDEMMEEQLPKPKYPRVLLILIQHGANGLNLLEAQHVILVEPLLNPAAEAQAISRVHRIGQEKQTVVHRFLVQNTVEESIYKMSQSRAATSITATKSKYQDHPILTIQDVESLFATAPSSAPAEDEPAEDGNVPVGSLNHLPPSVAAGLAAERRLLESQARASGDL